jgi:hypothetical protein
MAAEEVVRPMPVCENCFLDEHTKWEPDSMDEEGNVLMRLIGVDTPLRANPESVETCSLCGSITVAGIYEMFKPSEVYFDENSQLENKFEMPLNEFFGEPDEGF